MRFRFRLRTLLVVFTALAVCVGLNLTILRLVGFPKEPFDTTWMAANAVSRLPFYLVCAIGGMAVFERRRECPQLSRLVLVAVGIALSWDILVPLSNELLHRIFNPSNAMRLVSAGRFRIVAGLIDSIINATCWGLLLIAFLRAAADKQ